MVVETREVREEDELFLFNLYASSRQEELVSWGWSEAEKCGFLRRQFYLQQKSYKMQYPNMERKIIMSAGVGIGQISTAQAKGDMVLVNMALLPAYRGQGIGTTLLAELQHEAAKAGVPIRLSVLNGNPASRLYERLGFRCIDSGGVYSLLRWP